MKGFVKLPKLTQEQLDKVRGGGDIKPLYGVKYGIYPLYGVKYGVYPLYGIDPAT